MNEIHNSKNDYDVLVIIARCQPVHLGHLDLIRQALDYGARKVLILIGSARTARSPRNPFTYQERESMLRLALNSGPPQLKAAYWEERIRIFPLGDRTYDNEGWVAQVNDLIQSELLPEQSAAIFGYSKDTNTAWYLNMFGAVYGSVEAEPYIGSREAVLSATDIREVLFARPASVHGGALDGIVPETTANCLSAFLNEEPHFGMNWNRNYLIGMTPAAYLWTEYEEIKRIKAPYKDLKYPPIFHTVDPVVIQSGHVLAVERGGWPGKGLIAFPGGYLSADEWPIQSCLRELSEETGIKTSKRVLMGALKRQEQFADPHRSLRGRMLTDAFLFHLDPRPEFPRVRGGDDAAGAFWLPLDDFHEEKSFEDHYWILQKLRGYLKDQPA